MPKRGRATGDDGEHTSPFSLPSADISRGQDEGLIANTRKEQSVPVSSFTSAKSRADASSETVTRRAFAPPLSSPVTSSHDSTDSDGGGGSGDSDDDDVAQRLLAHAKLTAQVMAQRRRADTADHDTSAMPVAAVLRNATANTSAARPASDDDDRATSLAATLRHLRVELTRPVAMSTALTVVDTADESAEVMARVVAAKLPPPSAGDAKKLRRLTYVDHSRVTYRPIRKAFYVAPPDVRGMSSEELRQVMKELDGVRVRGNGQTPLHPMRSWHGAGLPDKVLAVLEARDFRAPFAVQSVGAPVLMSGRDLLVTAKTGSGKTLCYALALLRHCIDQPRCGKNEGPIGLVLVPTQELAGQVYELLGALCDAARLRCVASYGSTSLSDNIRHVKAGCEVMVATPGRLLDLLTVNGGTTMTLTRTSFVVVDEADRLFDSGFMEHVEAFLKNTRPDRQVAMISATMPRELKKIVLQHLHDPIEITVGGRATPASNVEQSFYFFDEEVYETDETKRRESARFVRLLQLLADEGGEEGSRLMLVFTQHKQEVDELAAKLAVLGYEGRVATLYAGMDPIDREFALEHFVPGKQFILIATAVAERGLDIPALELVINYTLPNHYEAYVHRIGRTGRAGRPGRAVSFFVRGKDDDLAPELVEGLERAGQQVPEELYERANTTRELRKDGLAHYNSGFYRGYCKGKAQKLASRDQKEQIREAAKAAGLDEFLSSDSSATSDSDASEMDGEDDGQAGHARRASEPAVVAVPVSRSRELDPSTSAASALTLYSPRPAARSASDGALTVASRQAQQVQDRIRQALAFAQQTTEAVGGGEHAEEVRFQVEYPINDLPDMVRIRLQNGVLLRSVAEETGTSIIRKGVYYDPRYKHSHKLKQGERPLYLLIVGKTTDAVQEARHRLNEARDEVMSRQRKNASAVGATL